MIAFRIAFFCPCFVCRDGVLDMEHGNSRPGKEGDMAVIEAYRAADDF
jgi:hypothetical protein